MSLQLNIVNTLAKGGALAFSARILSTLLGLATTVILTRFLGAHIFGIYALGVSISRVSSKISLLGMNNGILRFFRIYRENPKELRGLITSAFGIVIGATLMLMLFFFLMRKEYTFPQQDLSIR